MLLIARFKRKSQFNCSKRAKQAGTQIVFASSEYDNVTTIIKVSTPAAKSATASRAELGYGDGPSKGRDNALLVVADL
jgi:hypothetical protein